MKKKIFVITLGFLSCNLILIEHIYAKTYLQNAFKGKYSSVRNNKIINSYCQKCHTRENFKPNDHILAKRFLYKKKFYKKASECRNCHQLEASQTRHWKRLGLHNNPNFSFGISTWISSGEAHEALFSTGNNTSYTKGSRVSDLFWEDLDSSIIQVDAELKILKKYYLYTDYAFGAITNSKLTDKDFLTNGTEFSKTVSKGDGSDLLYLNVHFGRELINLANGTGVIRIFLGYQRWEETVFDKGPTEEYILFDTDVTSLDTTDPDQKGITWDYSFDSIKIGLDAKYVLTDKIMFSSLVAYLPYAYLNAEDFHHLREGTSSQDAGSPFVTWNNSGDGFNIEGALSYQLFSNWILSIGYRYWELSSNDNPTTFRFGDGSKNSNSRTNDFYSKRYGITFGITFAF